MITLVGELKCFECARYLGDFKSHPDEHGPFDVHLLPREGGELPAHAVASERGLRCSRCGGRAVYDQLERAIAV